MGTTITRIKEIAYDDIKIGDIIEPLSNCGHSRVTPGNRYQLLEKDMGDYYYLTFIGDAGTKIRWACTEKNFDVIRPSEKSTSKEVNIQKPPKTETKMSDSSTTTGFQVLIPEQAIQERVDKLVMYKLRHEKVHGILTEVVSDEKKKLAKLLKDELLKELKDDYTSKKDRIIESYLESKRTQIHLAGELKAVIDNPSAHKELPKLISYLQLFKQAMVVGPTGLSV